jgi:hypothetical protein
MAALHPVQMAYHVPDAAAAARHYSAQMGWGPFFLLEHIALAKSLHRGCPARFDHTSAYGQAGELMVEFIMQHDDAPSALRDLFGANETGIHHVACFVPSLTDALEKYRRKGFEVALEARTVAGDVDFAMIDTSSALGHMLELYEETTALQRFYAHVRRAAHAWDGTDPVRRI